MQINRQMEQGVEHAYISVIIPSYNSIKTVKDTIDNIQKLNSYHLLKEIIVVDSSDDEVSQDYYKALNIPIFKLIISGTKVMPAKQRNIGAETATGELLVFIDSDAYPDENWISAIDKAYKSGIKVGGGSYRYPACQAKIKHVVAEYYLQFNEYIPVGETRRNKMVPSCNLFCEKDFFDKIGGFPNIRASEDSLFGIKANTFEPLMFCPDAIVNHIFRENIEHFFNNQLLLGKYVYIYRKKNSQSLMYSGIIPYLLYPVFVFYKLFSIYFRLLKAGDRHFRSLNRSIGSFLYGWIWWSKGILLGINYCRGKSRNELLEEEINC